MTRIYAGEDLGDRPIWERQNLKNPFAGEDAPESHGRAIESAARVRAPGFPEATKVAPEDVGKVRRHINRARLESPGSTLGYVREGFRAAEAIPDALFDTVLLQEQQVALLDGFETPGFLAHREVIVEGEPFNDYRKIRQTRMERVPDLGQYTSPREEVDLVEVQEKDATDIGPGIWFRQRFNFDWETSTIRDLDSMLRMAFGAGEAANRTIEKYVFVTNLTDNPSVVIDGGSAVSLIADHSTARGIDNDQSLGSPTAANLDTLLDEFSSATIDGEAIGKSFGFIIAKTAGSAYRQALRTVAPLSERSPDNANNSANLYGRGRDFPFRVLPVDVISSATTWYATMDFRRSPSLGFQMRWFRGLNTPQIIDVDGPSGSRNSRITMSREFMIQLVGAGAWADVAGVYKGN